MKIEKRFLLFFIIFILLVIVTTASVAIFYLHESFNIIKNCSNTSLIPVMADRMFTRFLIGFLIVLFSIACVSIPVGLFLSRLISHPYLSIFKNLRTMAKKRLTLDRVNEPNDNEIATLNNYISILMSDFIKIKEYEKINAWKDGARMLIHEIKNPMTPLKLSAQRLSFRTVSDTKIEDDVTRILTAIADMENILRCFKELVNIEFAQREEFDIRDYITTILQEKKNHGIDFKITENYSSHTIRVLSEKALLKMLFVNLINNGIDENSDGFLVNVLENEQSLLVSFITPGKDIEEISKIFKLGYSKKGAYRGFGLFLCRKISDYLELNLTCSNTDIGVEFSIEFAKQNNDNNHSFQ